MRAAPPGLGLLATSGRHRPDRAARRRGIPRGFEDLGAPPRTPALLGDAAADHLAGHHKGYQPPRTRPRSFGW